MVSDALTMWIAYARESAVSIAVSGSGVRLLDGYPDEFQQGAACWQPPETGKLEQSSLY